jgi:hypothetical protein
MNNTIKKKALNFRGSAAEIKYIEFLTVLYNKRIFHRKSMEREYLISSGPCTYLLRKNYLERNDPHQLRWIGPAPSMDLVRDILEHGRKANSYHQLRKRIEKANEKLAKPNLYNQAQSIVEVPEEDEEFEICDTSNSKMLLIMAVGLVIGFLIATAIWK